MFCARAGSQIYVQLIEQTVVSCARTDRQISVQLIEQILLCPALEQVNNCPATCNRADNCVYSTTQAEIFLPSCQSRQLSVQHSIRRTDIYLTESVNSCVSIIRADRQVYLQLIVSSAGKGRQVSVHLIEQTVVCPAPEQAETYQYMQLIEQTDRYMSSRKCRQLCGHHQSMQTGICPADRIESCATSRTDRQKSVQLITDIVVRYHCGGWPKEVNSCFLNSYMVYL